MSEFNAAGVDYIVIGGHAVNAYGVPRMTKDLDLYIRASTENSERVFRALNAFGAPLAGASPQDFCDQESIFQVGVEPGRIDLLQVIPAVSFEHAWANRVTTLIDGNIPVSFISRDDLIANKLASGRPQDLADVYHLRRVAGAKPLK